MRVIKLLLLNIVTIAYQIIDHVNPASPKIISTCDNIDPRLFNTITDISIDLSNKGFDLILNQGVPTGSICNEPHVYYGYVHSYNNFSNIKISNKLLTVPNTLHNICLHEILHSFGLGHTTVPGMMSYRALETWDDNIVNDRRKLWLSVDDMNGLTYLKNR